MRTPIISKTPVGKAVALSVGIGLAILSYPGHAAPASGGDTVQGLYEVLLTTMKNGHTLGQSGRFTQLEPVILRTFDIPTMARLSVGPSWATLTEAQRQQVIESFGRYISAIYADRFDSYAGQKLLVTGEQPNGVGVRVRSQIIKANGETVNVDYMMHRNADSWLIFPSHRAALRPKFDRSQSRWQLNRRVARLAPPELDALPSSRRTSAVGVCPI